ncbi:mucoidy inhibitor MuiA family protein [Streptomyces sp. NBC_01294]|uniref:mucoidy inhibitor MuiA family protein n=1 Tax=Streptomyces sp. NBC_01294 TaxID=2903815 RepID=UPI002DDAE5C6|nr:mucoidy inhibitor MuiA family protein [Streptomyces sp. NBC_01294]WRZ60719.1 mucoidy inhibitor MuiA family protein [Streptomyces sp. NBC_01294]
MSTAPKPIALPVTAVTCLEDRAHVERAVVLDLEAGVQRLRLGPVSALAVDRTLHAELTAAFPATVLDVRIVRSWTPRGPLPSPDEDSALRHRVHALEEERLALGRQRDRVQARLGLLGRLAADLLREIGEGAGSGETERTRWASELDRVDGERDAHGEQLRTVDARLAALAAELREVQQAVHLSEEEPAELVGHIELTVEAAAAGPAELRLSHLTACALWRPAYRAVLDGDALTLETEAMVWQRTGEDWSDVRLTLSTARSALATDPPRLGEDRLTLGDRTAAERRTVDVELREEEIGALGPAPVLGLPGVDDGGEARVLSSPAPVSVPGDGRAHRVPISVFTTAASSEYACSPEVSPVVTQVVRCDNRSGHALLAGPVDLVRGSGFSGRGTLDFTAPGAPVELAFGSCDDHAVVRETEESRDSAGIMQRTVVTRTVRLHLSRFSAPGEHGDRMVALRERIPVSEVSAVDVRLRKDASSPAPEGVDPEGIVRWDIALPPGGRRTVTLVYELSASAKVAGL